MAIFLYVFYLGNYMNLKPYFIFFAFIFQVFIANGSEVKQASKSQPNILVIMSDDQGIGDIGFSGSKYAQTPSLDKLASQSAWFSNFIAGPACSPSRASFLTGRNYTSTGVWGVGPRAYINRDEAFLPEYLNRAGYQTAHFGKWGEGWTPDQRPYIRGYNEGAALGGGYQHQNPMFDLQGKLEQKKGWTVDVIADMTIDFIRRQNTAKKPWYAISAFISPHSPWECDKRYSEALEKQGYSKPLAAFYGMIAQMDEAIHRILNAIVEGPDRDNTIIIFMSDNGPTAHCDLTGGTPEDSSDWEKRNALHLRGAKSMVWQNALKVPFFVHWPSRIPPGTRTQFGTIEDILPTLLDITGVSSNVIPNHLPLHGTSLKSVLFDEKTKLEDRYLFRMPVAQKGAPDTKKKMIIEDATALNYAELHTSMRGERFVFHSLPGGKQVLYDLQNDSGELADVSLQYPELTHNLAKRCQSEWSNLIQSERCFKMPSFLIGDSRYDGMVSVWAHLGTNIVPCNAAQKVLGAVTCPFSGAKGFAEAMDSATYSMDVRRGGLYEILLSGDKLDKCGALEVFINGNLLKTEKVNAKSIKFKPTSLPLGIQSIEVRSTSKGSQEASLKEFVFRAK